MYLDGGMGGGGWLLTSFFSISYILGLVCYKHTIHVVHQTTHLHEAKVNAKVSMQQLLDSLTPLPGEVVYYCPFALSLLLEVTTHDVLM